eukprot:1157275-Pelagomonas_calceolata.AAC.5
MPDSAAQEHYWLALSSPGSHNIWSAPPAGLSLPFSQTAAPSLHKLGLIAYSQRASERVHPCMLVLAQALLEDHGRQKELRERREREKREKELRRLADLEAARSEDSKRPGYQRLRAQQVCRSATAPIAAASR